ncbi:MAG: hypothetical protein ACJ8GN_11060 [Longimicrobiaceae bacterium]
MMTDEEIAEQLQGRGLEEEYVRELLASLGYDPADGLTETAIHALDTAEMETRRKAALRTLELGARRS